MSTYEEYYKQHSEVHDKWSFDKIQEHIYFLILYCNFKVGVACNYSYFRIR